MSVHEHTQSSTTTVAVTVTSRLRQSRAAILFLALLVVAPVLIGLAAHSVWLHVRAPDFGIRTWDGLYVVNADARWPGVERDDRIAAVNGRRFATSVEVRDYLLALPPGEVEIAFARGERSWTLRAASRPWPLADQIAIWLRVSTSALLFCIGLGVYLARPDARTSLLFLLFTYFSSLIVCLNWIAPSTAWEARLFPFAILVTATTGLHLFAVFPTVNRLFARFPWLHPAIYLPVAVLPPIWMLREELPRLWAVADVSLWLWFATGALLGNVLIVTSFVRSWRRGDQLSMSRMRPVLIGAAVGYIVPAVVHTAIGILHWQADNRLVYEGSISFVAAFAVGMGYSLVRHNVMAVDRFTAAVLAYGTSIVFLCLGYGVLIGAALGSAYLLGVAQSLVVTNCITALSVLSLRPAFHAVKGRLDRLFARERLTADQTFEILQSLRTRTQAEGATRDEALRDVLAALEPLGHQRAELWLLCDDGSELLPQISLAAAAQPSASEEDEQERAPDPVKSLPAECVLASALRSGRSGGVPGLCSRELEPEAASELWSAGLALAVPLLPHGEFAGFVGLGRRTSGTSYSTDELVLAGHVGGQATVILERSTGTRMGRYRIEKRLGVGGMAEVFLARQMGPGGFERRIALKRPLPDLVDDPQFVAMFLEEARIAARLQHENIAQIYEVDKHHDHYYLTMEYVDGPSVRSLLRSCAKSLVPVPLPVALTITADLLRALAHVHAYTGPNGQELALIHRDVNPNNVLLRTDGKGKLVDFGIARAGDRLMRTQTGHVRGTVPYMSPEQAHGAADVDQRTDVYSAAVVCYEMLTALRAFPNGPQRERPKALCAARPDAPHELEAVLARAMAFERDERQASAAELLDDLRRASDADVVSSHTAVAALIAQMNAPAGDEAAAAMRTLEITSTFS